jgi:hypothetical protein
MEEDKMSITIQKDIHEICEFLQIDGASKELIISSTMLGIDYTHLMQSIIKTQHDIVENKKKMHRTNHERLRTVLNEVKLVRNCLDTCNIKLKDIEIKAIGTKENNYPIKEDLRI